MLREEGRRDEKRQRSEWEQKSHSLLDYMPHWNISLVPNVTDDFTVPRIPRWAYQTTLPASWETCVQVKKQQLELDMEQPTVLKLGKEYAKAVLLSPWEFNLYAEYIMPNAGLDEA